MPNRAPQIVALGGGGFSMERDSSLLDDYVLSLVGAGRRGDSSQASASRSGRPRVCFLPTASGDADHYVVRFYRRFSPSCEASHLSLFRRDQCTDGVEDDLATHLLSQDLIYVGGGNMLSMLGAWRAHGLDAILRKAWRRGIVMCGPSAGSLCWFEQALSAFHGAPRIVRGLGLLPYSNCVHYDAEPQRREEYHSLVGEGMSEGYAADDGAASASGVDPSALPSSVSSSDLNAAAAASASAAGTSAHSQPPQAVGSISTRWPRLWPVMASARRS